MYRRKATITFVVSPWLVLVLHFLPESGEAWLRRETQPVNQKDGFQLRDGGRKMNKIKSKKSSKSDEGSKSSKDGVRDHGYYDYQYYYPGDTGFLDEDITGDFEDMYGYFVTTDNFSFPGYHSKSSKKDQKSHEHGYYLSYPIYDKSKGNGKSKGKGGKASKLEKLPYHDPYYEDGKGIKGEPKKLTRPPSFPSNSDDPPVGPPTLQASPDDPDNPDETDGPQSSAPSSLVVEPPSTPTPTSLEPGEPTDQSEEPTMTPGIGINETIAPTVSLNETTDETKSLKFTENISFPSYSLTYTTQNNEMPSRETDFTELTAVTRSVFKEHMDLHFEEFPLSILVDFQTDFVKTGISIENQLFVVYRSTAFFDKGSFVIPEAEQLEVTLKEALQQDEILWIEYLTALQELSSENAFSFTVNVVYGSEPPPSQNSNVAVKVSSSAVAAIAAAAAGVVVAALALFVLRRKRMASTLMTDANESPAKGKERTQSFFRSNGRMVSDSDTESNTYGTSSFGLQTVPLAATLDSTTQDDEENGSIANCSSVYISGEQSTKADDWSKYDTYSFDKADAHYDEFSEYSDDAIASDGKERSEKQNLINEKMRSSKKRHPWTDIPAKDTRLNTWHETKKAPSSANEELTERKRGGTSLRVCEQGTDLEDLEKQRNQRLDLVAHQRAREQSRQIDEKKLDVERAALNDWLTKEKMTCLEQEKRLTEEKLQAELAKTKAEEAARAAQELRETEEKLFASEKEAFESRLMQQKRARKFEEKKLAEARKTFQLMVMKDKEESTTLEIRLAQKNQAGDEKFRKTEKNLIDTDKKINMESRTAKEAIVAERPKFEDDKNAARLLEEELFVRQLRASEADREESMKGSRQAPWAIKIQKSQHLKFEENEMGERKSQDVETWKSTEEKVEAELTESEALCLKQAYPTSEESSVQAAAISEEESSEFDDCQQHRLSVAMRLAQSWGTNSLCRPNEEMHQNRSQDALLDSMASSELPENELKLHESACDKVVGQLCREKYIMSCAGEPGQHTQLRQKNNDFKENEAKGITRTKTDDAPAKTRHIQSRPNSEEDSSIVSDLVLPLSMRRKERIEDAEPIVPKIGPAQFIAPWKGNAETDEKIRKSRSQTRKKKGVATSCDQSMNSENQAERSTASSSSVDDDDTCSEFSLRTSTTMSSGYSKILPR